MELTKVGTEGFLDFPPAGAGKYSDAHGDEAMRHPFPSESTGMDAGFAMEIRSVRQAIPASAANPDLG